MLSSTTTHVLVHNSHWRQDKCRVRIVLSYCESRYEPPELMNTTLAGSGNANASLVEARTAVAL